MKEHATKRSVNTVSSLVLYRFIKREKNLRLTIYKIEMYDNVPYDNVPDIVPDGLLKLVQTSNFSACPTGTKALIKNPNICS